MPLPSIILNYLLSNGMLINNAFKICSRKINEIKRSKYNYFLF